METFWNANGEPQKWWRNNEMQIHFRVVGGSIGVYSYEQIHNIELTSLIFICVRFRLVVHPQLKLASLLFRKKNCFSDQN